jgi:hypothetical protein
MSFHLAPRKQPRRYDWEERLRNASIALRVSAAGDTDAVSLTDLFEDGGRPEELKALRQAAENLAVEQNMEASVRISGGSFTVRFTRTPP